MWQGHLGVGLKGRTLGIAGYGKIRSVVAGYGRAIGMRVVTLGDHESSATADGLEVESGFAAVDVHDHEPILGAQHPLLALDNVPATPHIGYVEKDTYEHDFGIAVEQLLALKAGSPINLLNPDALAN